jgi:hypothetical protein
VHCASSVCVLWEYVGYLDFRHCLGILGGVFALVNSPRKGRYPTLIFEGLEDGIHSGLLDRTGEMTNDFGRGVIVLHLQAHDQFTFRIGQDDVLALGGSVGWGGSRGRGRGRGRESGDWRRHDKQERREGQQAV